MPKLLIRMPSNNPNGYLRCPSANHNFILVFLMAGFSHASHMLLVPIVIPAPLSSVSNVFTSLYSIGRVIFLSSLSQQSPTLLRGIGCPLVGVLLALFKPFMCPKFIPLLMPIFSRVLAKSFHRFGCTLSNSLSVSLHSMWVGRRDERFFVSFSPACFPLIEGNTFTLDLVSCSPKYWENSFRSSSQLC